MHQEGIPEKDQVLSKLFEILSSVLDRSINAGHMTPDMSIRDSRLKFDSLDLAEFIMLVEKEFDISIDDETAGNAETFGRLADVVIDECKKRKRLGKLTYCRHAKSRNPTEISWD